MEKALFDRLMNRLRRGGVKVTFWDGTTKTYGPDEPYFAITIKNPRVLRAMARNLTLGFGEGYMNGDIDVEGDITQVGRLASDNQAAFANFDRILKPLIRRQRNHRSRQRRQISHHYDLGNEFYRLWLDDSMTYSCAYFRTPKDSLELAQTQKVDYILRKLQLKRGQTLLDIGSGWGRLLIAAAQQYGVRGHGVTLSQEQYDLSRQRIAELGLSDQITIELANYQDLPERGLRFDRIVSVGMYEHVGRGNHGHYFDAVKKMLAPDGLSVLHNITNRSEEPTDAWIDRYIFPGGFLPSVAATTALMEQYGFELQDYENLRYHYALTLDEWLRRFEKHRDKVIEMYDERFFRMWRLYLGGSISGFRYGDLSLSQFVMTPGRAVDPPLTREHLYR